MAIRGRLLLAALSLAVAAAVELPLTASAHALPQRSSPAAGSSVPQPPSQVSIVFGETPDPSLSSVSVVDSSGTDVDAGRSATVPGQPVALEVPLRPHLPNGVYTVSWRTVSAVDGHLAAGSFAFGVGVAADKVPATSSSTGTAPGVLAIAARTLLFAGLIVVTGAVVLGFFAFGTVPRPLRHVIAAGAAITDVGTLGVVGAQMAAAGVTPTTLLESSLGRSLIARGLPALVLSVGAASLSRGRRIGLSSTLLGVAALVAMVVDVVNSHAAAQSPIPLNELAQWLHIVAVAVWIGGLVALVVILVTTPAEEKIRTARRLSTLAGIGLVVVAATGVFRAVIEVQTWGSLVSTAFGVLVLIKAGLLLVLAALGALNRFRNLPRLPRTLRSLRRLATTEIVIGLATVAVAAALVNVAPPAEYASAQGPSKRSSVVLSESDYATTIKMRLTVTPGLAGFNTFTADVTAYDTGAPVPASSVLLQFTQPFRPSLGTSTLTLSRQADGSYSARGSNVSLNGVWEIAAIVQGAQQSAEVHLQLVTTEPTPAVQVVKEGSGLPTLYTVQMTPQISAQVYLDPDKPGPSTFHITFFDAKGNEASIPRTAVGMTPSSGSPVLLATRPLDNVGHYVADATVRAEPTRFDVLATTASGQSISTYLWITPGK